jgi:nucleoside-diphosphate-sugar epimerase
MEKVIVTGGAGFIGSYVVKELLSKNYSVTVVDNLSKKDSKIPGDANFINLDLIDAKKTLEAFKGFDICINMASKIGGIGYFHKYPATILSENNKIYSSTFEACAKNKIKKMVFLSSSMVFESTNKFPSTEKDINLIPPPLTGYGFSKLVGEYYCRTFKEEYGLPYTIIRPFNAYGVNEYPGDYIGYAHVIPDLIKKILSGQYPLEILGDGEQTRCFTHVSDVAKGIVNAMESKHAVNEDFNIGNEEETRIIDLARMLWSLCGRKEKFSVKSIPSFEFDIKRRVPDVSKAKKLLGYNPGIRLEDGLKEVFVWLRKECKQ